jgi:hypothetical protein
LAVSQKALVISNFALNSSSSNLRALCTTGAAVADSAISPGMADSIAQLLESSTKNFALEAGCGLLEIPAYAEETRKLL